MSNGNRRLQVGDICRVNPDPAKPWTYDWQRDEVLIVGIHAKRIHDGAWDGVTMNYAIVPAAHPKDGETHGFSESDLSAISRAPTSDAVVPDGWFMAPRQLTEEQRSHMTLSKKMGGSVDDIWDNGWVNAPPAPLPPPPAREAQSGYRCVPEDLIGAAMCLARKHGAQNLRAKLAAIMDMAINRDLPSSGPGAIAAALSPSNIPPDIAEVVRLVGRAEWGSTPAHDAREHGQHVAESVRLTAEHFSQTGPQQMHGLYIHGTGTVICHTGTSPNSPNVARALTGIWNMLHDAVTQPAVGADQVQSS